MLQHKKSSTLQKCVNDVTPFFNSTTYTVLMIHAFLLLWKFVDNINFQKNESSKKIKIIPLHTHNMQ